MNASSPIRRTPSHRPGLLAVVAVALVLGAACTASSPSASPSSEPSPTRSPMPTAPTSPSPEPSGPAPTGEGSWEPAGATTFAWLQDKVEDSAVQLQDGRVLVVGEPSDVEEPAGPSAELWDPSSNGWAETTGLDRPRSWFAMVPLEDGRALVAGGLNGGWGDPDTASYSSAYTFDPDDETWTKVGLMTTARTAPSAFVLPDGRVLVAGGYFHTGETAAAPGSAGDPGIVLAGYRQAPPPGPLPSRPPLDDVDIAPYGYALATAEIFDPATDTWSATGPMRYARVGPAMVTLADGRVLVVGSSSAVSVTEVHPDAYVTAELYDPATGRFSMADTLPPIDHEKVADMGVTLPDDEGDPGAIGTLVAQPDGDAVLVGNGRWWKHTADIDRTFRFDVDSAAWTEIGQPCASARDDALERWVAIEGGCRRFDLVAGLSDGRALGAGGYLVSSESDPEPVTDSQLLDPVDGSWTPAAPMPTVRQGGIAVTLRDESVVVFGGLVDGEFGQEAVRYVPGQVR